MLKGINFEFVEKLFTNNEKTKKNIDPYRKPLINEKIIISLGSKNPSAVKNIKPVVTAKVRNADSNKNMNHLPIFANFNLSMNL